LKPCYDQAALVRRYELIRAISDAMLGLGWGPYQSDHEDANGQFEMNWTNDDALVTADRHVFFKFMVEQLAEQQGLRATSMPKPFMHLIGKRLPRRSGSADARSMYRLGDDRASCKRRPFLAIRKLGAIQAFM